MENLVTQWFVTTASEDYIYIGLTALQYTHTIIENMQIFYNVGIGLGLILHGFKIRRLLVANISGSRWNFTFYVVNKYNKKCLKEKTHGFCEEDEYFPINLQLNKLSSKSKKENKQIVFACLTTHYTRQLKRNWRYSYRYSCKSRSYNTFQTRNQ